MSIDYYFVARSIAARLEEAGFQAEAQSLRDAIAAGATSTEILMALRWNLLKIESNANIVDLDIREQIRMLLIEISKVLR